jgi:phospho-N-acetylmuramoyl-pentapeptide-transferase
VPLGVGDPSAQAGAFLVALVVSGILAWPIYRLLLAVKSRQTVSQYLGEGHQAKQGTPTMGGLIILVGLIAGLASATLEAPLLVLALGFGAIGFLDDFVVPRFLKGKRGLGWIPKLGLELLVTVAYLVLPGMAMSFGDKCIFAFLVLFGANAYNFADGLDGLAGGLLIILASTMWFLVWGGGTGVLFPALVGATIPFLFLNAPPAKVFMGDVGSLPIGALLGTSAAAIWTGNGVHSNGAGPFTNRLAVVVLGLVLIAELVPVPLQILSVKLRHGKRLFPRTPIHHTFEFWGWPESKITWTFLLAQAVCAGCALSVVALGVGR